MANPDLPRRREARRCIREFHDEHMEGTYLTEIERLLKEGGDHRISQAYRMGEAFLGKYSSGGPKVDALFNKYGLEGPGKRERMALGQN